MDLSGLVELAADRVMPLWVAQRRGLTVRLGILRWSWLYPSSTSTHRYRVPWLAYSEADTVFPPHVLRHALILSVARYYLGAAPDEWDSLVVREVRHGATRRSIRGREWARHTLRDRRVSRPDAEYWTGLSSPYAVEVDTAKIPMTVYLSRVKDWIHVYMGVVIVTPSPTRARQWRQWFSLMEVAYPGWKGAWSVYWVEWWKEEAVWMRM